MSDESEITAVSVVVGALLGLLLSGACLLIAITVGSAIHGQSGWIFLAVNAALLVIAGTVAFRSYRYSGIARGVIVVLALAFALTGLCGMTLLR